MIIDEVTYTCPGCGGPDLVNNGKNAYGNQQFRCKTCGKTGVLHSKNRHTPAEIEQILAAYRERPSMGGIARIFRISRKTLTLWLKKSPATTLAQSDASAKGSG